MEPIIAQVNKDAGVDIERLEVWYDEKNAATLATYDKDLCGGVPFFFNTDTKKWICGEATYDELKSWALGDGKHTAH